MMFLEQLLSQISMIRDCNGAFVPPEVAGIAQTGNIRCVLEPGTDTVTFNDKLLESLCMIFPNANRCVGGLTLLNCRGAWLNLMKLHGLDISSRLTVGRTRTRNDIQMRCIWHNRVRPSTDRISYVMPARPVLP